MKRFLLINIFVVFLLWQIGTGQIPQIISYQGILTDTTSTIVPDGSYDLTFNLYDAETGGSALWTEMQTVELNNGIFNVYLGSVTPMNTTTFENQYWLGVIVQGGSELAPRIKFTSSPYSLNSLSVVDSAITTSKIADEAVTQAKLAPGVILPPGGSAGGDLSGTYPDPTVIGIQGMSISATTPDTGQVLKWNGSEWSPGSDNADSSAWASAGNNIFNINNGNVGIGTTNPSSKLEIRQSDNNSALRIESGLPEDNYHMDIIPIAPGSGIINYKFTTNRDDLQITNDVLTLTQSGLVGIGTPGPTDKLHVTDAVDFSIKLDHTGTNGEAWSISNLAGTSNTATLRFYNEDDAQEYMRITSMGNVGIGTTTPVDKLEVAGTIRSTTGGYGFPDGTTQSTAAVLPTGIIVMWSGTLATIPSGWALCDGTNNTPNLSDRFIYGVHAGEDPGTMGGTLTHTHAVDIPAFNSGGSSSNYLVNSAGLTSRAMDNHIHSINPPSTLSSEQNHLPPYFKLAFIMKL